jgi:hypothetical protein
MKVIGTMGRRSDYIVSVSHTELEKFLGLYYGKLNELHVGQEIDLGKGYDHASEIAHAMRTTQEFVKANQQVVTAILNGLRAK